MEKNVNITTRLWARALIAVLSTIVAATGLAVAAPVAPALASASPAASARASAAAVASSTEAGEDDGLGPFGSLSGDPMNGYRLYEVPTDAITPDIYDVDALGPNGEVAGRAFQAGEANLTPFVFIPGVGTEWLEQVPYSLNRVGGFDAKGNIYGTAGDGTRDLDEVVVWKWGRNKDGYTSPQAIFHGDSIAADWQGSITAVNAGGDVLLGDGNPPVLLRGGQATVLPSLVSDSYPDAWDLNDKGQAVGGSLWDQGSPRGWEPTSWTSGGAASSLGYPPLVFENAEAREINNKGQVVVGNPTSDQDPWLRQPNGQFSLFAVPPNAPATSLQQVDDLNDDGVAVGFYQSDGASPALQRRAALWTREGQRVQLFDQLLPDGLQSHWQLTRAFAVNDAGMVAGTGRHDGREVAWLAVPIDPVVFVHGAGASSLETVDADGVAQRNVWMSCSESRKQMSLWKTDEAPDGDAVPLQAIDALRHEWCFVGNEIVNPALNPYGSFLDRLRGSYTEYDRKRRPALQTEAGCDLSQLGQRTPNLFVYAYDWRQDNRTSADGLAEYLKCVHKFWPDAKVDILTHSLGSVVARRYLMQNGGDDVDRMITIGAPWLGAPRLVNVLQTGDFAPQPVNGPRDVIKHIVGSFPAAHELAASRIYGDAARLPIVMEQGWDLNGDKNAWQSYAYDDVKQLLDAQNPTFKPGSTGDRFQSDSSAYGGQTDWRSDNTGVAFTHFVGLQAGADTIGSVVAERKMVCSGLLVKTCEQVDLISQFLVCGDGTVPYVSAERAGKGVDYNAPDAEVLVARSNGAGQNFFVEHTGMAQNDDIQDDILRRLFSPMVDRDEDGHRDPVEQDHSGLGQEGDDLDSCYQPATPDGQGLAPATQASPTTYGADNPAPGTGRRYVSVVGGEDMTVQDSAGHTTDPEGSTGGYVADVTAYPSDRADAGMVTFPESDTTGYTTSFVGTGEPLQLELLEGSQSSPTRAWRWTDVPVEDGQAVQLRTTADGREALEVDADGDGTPETPVPPTVKVGGSDAADTTAPVVTATRLTGPDGVRFGLSAADQGSGVAELMWSADGTHFQRYDVPIAAEPGAHLTAFATDRAGNRSAGYEFDADQVPAALFTSATVDPAPTSTGWTAGAATVTLHAQAPSGSEVSSITYRTTGAAGSHEETVAGDVAELEVQAAGTTTVTYFATAADGTLEPERSTQVRIDQSAPVVSVKQPTPTSVVSSLTTIRGKASDDASGVTGVEVELRNSAGSYWNGTAWTAQPTWLGASGTTSWSRSSGLPQGPDLADGAYRLEVRASDGAGHSAVVASAGFTVAPTAATTVRRLTVATSSRTSGSAINERGVAAGLFVTGDAAQAARWSNGKAEALSLTGSAATARVRAVDDAGSVYGAQLDPAGLTQPTRWGAGSASPTVLLTLTEDGSGEILDSTPDGATQVGWSSRGALDPHLPVRWLGGRLEPLPLTPGATEGEATGVAADGSVVGTLTTPAGRRAVLWPAEGGVRNLGTLAGHVASAAAGINDLGVIVGTSTDTNAWVHGFVWSGEEMHELERSFATRKLVPLGVDNAGTVVGEYTPSAGGETRAFATGAEGWADDLGGRLPTGSGWTLVTARGVNQLGQVVGFGIKDGRYDGFVLGDAHAPLTEDQTVSTDKDTGLAISLAGFDPDVADPVTYDVLDPPEHGSLGEVVDSRVDYTPDAGYEGTDDFTWKLSDPEYGSVPATVTITVGDATPDPDQPPTIEIAAAHTGEEGSAITLHATATDPEGAALQTTWSVTGGVLSGSGDDVTLTLPDGPDEVTVTASTTDGSTSVSATAGIEVRNAPPTAGAGPDVTVGEGVPLTLQGAAGDPSVDDAAALSSRWDFGDGSSGSGPTVSHAWSRAGVYTVTFTVTDPDGARSTDHLQVTVDPAPGGSGASPVAKIRVKPKVPGADRKVRFVGKQSSGTGELTYTWNFHNGGTKVDASGRKVKTFYRRVGEHSVTLVVSDSTGASDKVTERFRVHRHYSNPIAARAVRPGMFRELVALF